MIAVGDSQREGVGAVAVAGEQQRVAGLGVLQRRDQQHRREGRAGVAEPAEQRVLHLRLRLEAELLGRRCVAARVGSVEHGLGEVLRAAAGLLEQALHRFDHHVAIAVLDDEAVFPGMHEGIAVGAPDVDDLVGDA